MLHRAGAQSLLFEASQLKRSVLLLLINCSLLTCDRLQVMWTALSISRTLQICFGDPGQEEVEQVRDTDRRAASANGAEWFQEAQAEV